MRKEHSNGFLMLPIACLGHTLHDSIYNVRRLVPGEARELLFVRTTAVPMRIPRLLPLMEVSKRPDREHLVATHTLVQGWMARSVVPPC